VQVTTTEEGQVHRG